MASIEYYIYLIILLTSCIVGVINLKKLNNSNKCFLLLLFCTLIVEAIAPIITKNGFSNYVVYHIFTPIQCVLVLWGYYLEIKNKIILWEILFMVVLAFVMSFWIQPLPSINSYYMNIEILCFIFIVVYYFNKLLEIETEFKLKDYPLFWISCGLLIFCVSNLFVLGTTNFLKNSDVLSNKLLITILIQIRYFSNYLYYSSFIVAFLVKQNTISSQHDK